MSTQQAHVNVTAIVRKTLSDQPVLCVRSTQTEHTETDWCAVGEAIGEAWQVLERQALISAGPPYTRFHPGGWEAGVPVDRAGISEGRVVPAVLPGGDVASAYFAGNFWDTEKFEAVIANLRTQIKDAGIEPAGALRWTWLTAPELTPDPDNHYTELHWPVKG